MVYGGNSDMKVWIKNKHVSELESYYVLYHTNIERITLISNTIFIIIIV